MDLNSTPIQRIVPQRPPFLMVDRVVSCNTKEALTEFHAPPDNILMENGCLTAPGVIENMAQSCAALVGCVRLLNGLPVTIGFIGEIRNAAILRLPHSGDCLLTHVHILEELGNITQADVEVKVGGETIATARMKVARTDIVANLTD